MEEEKRLTIIETHLKIVLTQIDLLKQDRETTDFNLLNERLIKLEENVEAIRKAII